MTFEVERVPVEARCDLQSVVDDAEDERMEVMTRRGQR